MTRVTSQALHKSYGKERRQRCVFRRLQKTGRDDADVTWRGRSFQVELCADELVVGGGIGWSYDRRRRRRAAHLSSAAAA